MKLTIKVHKEYLLIVGTVWNLCLLVQSFSSLAPDIDEVYTHTIVLPINSKQYAMTKNCTKLQNF